MLACWRRISVADPILTVSELHAGYSDVEVLRGVDLDVQPGMITTIIGPNGAGKSTFLKAIFGMAKVTKGSIRLRGREMRHLSNRELLQAGISFVPQGRCNFPRMTVQENLEMGAFTLPMEVARRNIADTYERFPMLAEKRRQRAGVMSGGQQQVLELAMSLVVRPEVLLIDEPSLGLAPITLGEVLNEVQAISRAGVTVLMVEQNARQALERSERGVVLEMGNKAMEGTGVEMLADPRLAMLYLGGSTVSAEVEPNGGS
jgi:branched-chain amino acid transport system ATP-binding protein